MSGVSRLRPVLTASARRAYWDWAQVSGLAEPAGLPFTTPIESVVGLTGGCVTGRSGSSQACSGSRPWPLVMLPMAVRSVFAPAVSPAATSYAPRSPPRTGHRWPEPTLPVGHVLPEGEQLAGSGT